jgi:DNA-binding CsgD family transcriptional regulator
MADLPREGVAVAVEIGRIAAAPGGPAARAAELLKQLHRLVPYDGASLCVRDPDSGEFTPVAMTGYDAAIQAWRESPEYRRDVAKVGLDRAREAMCLRDLPVPPAEIRPWVELLEPAGFREGVSVGLYTSDGRYLGLLTLQTGTPTHPTDAARDLVGSLAPLIADAVDPLRSFDLLAQLVGGAEYGTVLCRGGAALPLPGLPTHPVLASQSALLTVAFGRLASGRTSMSFRWPATEALGGVRRVTVLRSPPRPPYHLTAIVLLSPAGDLHGLTRRELQIAGLLVDGWPNQRIAAALYITERTVAAHVEHILTKLNVPTRTAAAVHAVDHGLYIPTPPTLS